MFKPTVSYRFSSILIDQKTNVTCGSEGCLACSCWFFGLASPSSYSSSYSSKAPRCLGKGRGNRQSFELSYLATALQHKVATISCQPNRTGAPPDEGGLDRRDGGTRTLWASIKCRENSLPAADRTKVLTTPHRIKPTSTSRQSVWRPNPGRGSTYRGGKSVQTTGTSSVAEPLSHSPTAFPQLQKRRRSGQVLYGFNHT